MVWFLSGACALSMGINGYFLKKLVDNVTEMNNTLTTYKDTTNSRITKVEANLSTAQENIVENRTYTSKIGDQVLDLIRQQKRNGD